MTSKVTLRWCRTCTRHSNHVSHDGAPAFCATCKTTGNPKRRPKPQRLLTDREIRRRINGN